jgi:hypothetical protein
MAANGTTIESHPASVHDDGAVALVEGIVGDVRGLISAHVDALRDDMRDRLAALGATLTSTLFALAVSIVSALLTGLALAATIVVIGLPWWAALWTVAAASGALGLGLVRRVRHSAALTGTDFAVNQPPGGNHDKQDPRAYERD